MTTKKLTDYLKQQTPTQSSSKTEQQVKPFSARIRFKKETEFQETPIGKIPKEWTMGTLSQLVVYEKGKKPSKLYKEKTRHDLIPYLKAEYLRGLESPEWCEPTDANVLKVSKNDIIIIWDGSYSGDVFTGFEGALASTMVKIMPITTKLVSRYLYYWLRKYYNVIRSTTVGTGIPHVNRRVFENLLIPLPPRAEQEKIAELLSSIDSAIEKVRLLIDRAERLKKGLMQELLTKGIGHKEYKETPIGGIPKEWQVLRLGQLCQVRHGKRPEEILSEGPYPIYGAGGFSGYTTNYLSKGPWTIVVGRVGVGSVGKVYLVSGSVWVNDNAFYLLPLTGKAYIPFVYYALLLRDPKQLAMRSAGGYAIITQSLLEEIEIPLPPLEEQRRIAEILLTVDKYIESLGGKLKHLEHVKRGLMEVLLTGKVRVLVESS